MPVNGYIKYLEIEVLASYLHFSQNGFIYNLTNEIIYILFLVYNRTRLVTVIRSRCNRALDIDFF